jgi:general secretion pathway protein M
MKRIDSSKAGMADGVAAFWQQRSARERRVLGIGVVVLALALLWLLGVEPALDGRERWRKDLPQLRADAAEVQALSQQLASAPPRPANAAQALDKAALGASLNALGLKAQSLSFQDAGGVQLVRLNFADASFSALTEWLQQQQRASQLSVSEASVTARERLDRVDAQLTLRRQP